MTSLVLTMIALPAVAAIAMLLLDPKAPPSRARWTALIATIATFLVSWGVAAQFYQLPAKSVDGRSPVSPRYESRMTWLTLDAPKLEVTGKPEDDNSEIVDVDPGLRIEFFIGLDGISLAMIVLTTILTVSSVLVSWTSIQTRAAEFYACLLILETGLLGVFCAFDLVLFYVFFEFTLLPLFFMVGIWGGPLRRYAAAKFFVYTLAGGLITLLGLVALAISVHNATGLATPFSIPDLARALVDKPLSPELQTALFLAIAAGFLVKVPVFPFHTWLPLAHVEAPTAGSVMLAGVLLKL
jgi:NADH-quinone oxidoreductase subunit M